VAEKLIVIAGTVNFNNSLNTRLLMMSKLAREISSDQGEQEFEIIFLRI